MLLAKHFEAPLQRFSTSLISLALFLELGFVWFSKLSVLAEIALLLIILQVRKRNSREFGSCQNPTISRIVQIYRKQSRTIAAPN